MATSQQRTRAQIRQSVGQLTGQLWEDAGITSAPSETAPSAAKLIDENLAFGSENDHRGKWAYTTDSAGANLQRRVLASSPSERSLDFSVPLNAIPNSSWTYELWEPEISPTLAHEFVNQAITDVDRKGAVDLTSDSIHTGGGVKAWGLSSSINGVTQLEWATDPGEQITSLDNAMSSATNSTVVTNGEDLKEGAASNVITIAAAASTAETVATDCFSAIDMRGYTNVDFWVKSNTTLTSSGLQITLNQTSSALETLALPALNADSWTRVNLTLANPELDSGITRFVVQTGSSDAGAITVAVDDAVVYRARTEAWSDVPRDYWHVDGGRREITLEREAFVPYAKLKLTGVTIPALLTTDTAISQIDPMYVVNAATSRVFSRLGEEGKSRYHEALADRARNRMTTPSGVKWVDA